MWALSSPTSDGTHTPALEGEVLTIVGEAPHNTTFNPVIKAGSAQEISE